MINSNKEKENKSIAILYFSGTGNTKAITDLISKELSKKISVTVIKVEDIIKGNRDFDVEQYDTIGFGYPIHGFDAPTIIYQYIKSITETSNKNTFIYFTCAGPVYFNSNSTLKLKRKLKKKGYNVFYERIFYMPANFLTPYKKEICKQLYNAAIPKTKQMANDLLEEKSRLRKDPYFLRLLFGWMYYFEKLGWKFIGKDFKVRKSCNLCKKCINTCPRDNIILKNNKIKFKMKCGGCYRCVYTCPENAIKGRLYNFCIFKDGYDIQSIIKDDKLKGEFITEKTRGYYRIFLKYLTNVDV
ncbi:MAG: hypothetical protein FK733_12215 [Asgard group archaeon]|nr:hypothetical protein [Asgard group archaeon]